MNEEKFGDRIREAAARDRRISFCWGAFLGALGFLFFELLAFGWLL